MQKTAKMAIVRLIPSLVRGDGYNIGVILHDPDSGYLRPMFIERPDNVARLWPKIDPASVRDFVDDLRTSLKNPYRQAAFSSEVSSLLLDTRELEASGLFSDGYLNSLAEQVGGVIQLVDVRSFRIGGLSLDKELERLFERYVGEPPKPEKPKVLEQVVSLALSGADLVRPDALHKTERGHVEGKHNTLKAEYIGKNGVHHIVRSCNLITTGAANVANQIRGGYRDIAAEGSPYEGATLHVFATVPASKSIKTYGPSASLDDESGIHVYQDIDQGVDALRQTFMH